MSVRCEQQERTMCTLGLIHDSRVKSDEYIFVRNAHSINLSVLLPSGRASDFGRLTLAPAARRRKRSVALTA